MVKHYLSLIGLLFLAVSLATGQTKEKKPVEKPCQNPVILKASKQGLRSLKLREIPTYVIKSWQCRRSGVNKTVFRNMDRRQLQKDYDNSHQLKGWTSTGAYCVTSVVFFYFLEKYT